MAQQKHRGPHALEFQARRVNGVGCTLTLIEPNPEIVLLPVELRGERSSQGETSGTRLSETTVFVKLHRSPH